MIFLCMILIDLNLISHVYVKFYFCKATLNPPRFPTLIDICLSRFARRDFFIFSSDSILAAGRSPGKFTLNRIILERASDKLRPCARYSPECV